MIDRNDRIILESVKEEKEVRIPFLIMFVHYALRTKHTLGMSDISI